MLIESEKLKDYLVAYRKKINKKRSEVEAMEKPHIMKASNLKSKVKVCNDILDYIDVLEDCGGMSDGID